MANGRNKSGRVDLSRDPGRFIALPTSVVESAAYLSLSHPARSLLLEFAYQYLGDNNGRLLASLRYLSKRGWTSSDTLSRAKTDLLKAGFIFEMVKGSRPNKASWYAVTWRSLDKDRRYDAGTESLFERGAYKNQTAKKIDALNPCSGQPSGLIAPRYGAPGQPLAPPGGVINPTNKIRLVR